MRQAPANVTVRGQRDGRAGVSPCGGADAGSDLSLARKEIAVRVVL